VERSDSAGLALLVECLRQAHQSGKSLRFFNIPAQMLAIARVSSLDQVLPLQRD
jgi:phospholipid transport system transporter-binding protein